GTRRLHLAAIERHARERREDARAGGSGRSAREQRLGARFGARPVTRAPQELGGLRGGSAAGHAREQRERAAELTTAPERSAERQRERRSDVARFYARLGAVEAAR